MNVVFSRTHDELSVTNVEKSVQCFVKIQLQTDNAPAVLQTWCEDVLLAVCL